MNDSDLTPWFSGDVKPVRPGVYERAITIESGVSEAYLFDGRRWISDNGFESFFQNIFWRGLTKTAHDRMKREGK